MARPALNHIVPSSLQVLTEPGQAAVHATTVCQEMTSTEGGNVEKPGFYPKFPELEQPPCLLWAPLCPRQLWDVTGDRREESFGLGSSPGWIYGDKKHRGGVQGQPGAGSA